MKWDLQLQNTMSKTIMEISNLEKLLEKSVNKKGWKCPSCDYSRWKFIGKVSVPYKQGDNISYECLHCETEYDHLELSFYNPPNHVPTKKMD